MSHDRLKAFVASSLLGIVGWSAGCGDDDRANPNDQHSHHKDLIADKDELNTTPLPRPLAPGDEFKPVGQPELVIDRAAFLFAGIEFHDEIANWLGNHRGKIAAIDGYIRDMAYSQPVFIDPHDWEIGVCPAGCNQVSHVRIRMPGDTRRLRSCLSSDQRIRVVGQITGGGRLERCRIELLGPPVAIALNIDELIRELQLNPLRLVRITANKPIVINASVLRISRHPQWEDLLQFHISEPPFAITGAGLARQSYYGSIKVGTPVRLHGDFLSVWNASPRDDMPVELKDGNSTLEAEPVATDLFPHYAVLVAGNANGKPLKATYEEVLARGEWGAGDKDRLDDWIGRTIEVTGPFHAAKVTPRGRVRVELGGDNPNRDRARDILVCEFDSKFAAKFAGVKPRDSVTLRGELERDSFHGPALMNCDLTEK